MGEQRWLGVREYISELLQKGKIEDRPHLRSGPMLDPTYVVERNKKFFMAQQLVKNVGIDGSKAFVVEHKDIDSEFRLVYFPTNIESAEILSRSWVKSGGPQYKLPGSVAVLDISYDETNSMLIPEYLQHCFIQGSPPELTRSLVSKYIGARHHLLRFLFKMDLISNVNTIIFPEGLRYKPGNRAALEMILSESKVIQSQFTMSSNVLYRNKN